MEGEEGKRVEGNEDNNGKGWEKIGDYGRKEKGEWGKKEERELVNEEELIKRRGHYVAVLHAVAKFNKILHDQIHISQKTAQIRKDRLGFSVKKRGCGRRPREKGWGIRAANEIRDREKKKTAMKRLTRYVFWDEDRGKEG